jgi:hypothetical protein
MPFEKVIIMVIARCIGVSGSTIVLFYINFRTFMSKISLITNLLDIDFEALLDL